MPASIYGDEKYPTRATAGWNPSPPRMPYQPPAPPRGGSTLTSRAFGLGPAPEPRPAPEGALSSSVGDFLSWAVGDPAPIKATGGREPAARKQQLPLVDMAGLDMLRPDPFAGPEALLSMGTGMASMVPAGLHGAMTLAGTGSLEQASDAVGRAQGAMTYQPRTQGGQEALGQAAGVADALGAPSRWLGQTALEQTGSPLAATLAELLDPSMLIPGLKGAMLPMLARGASRVLPGKADELTGLTAPAHTPVEGHVFSARRPSTKGKEEQAFEAEAAGQPLTLDLDEWMGDERLRNITAERLRGNPYIKTTEGTPEGVIREALDQQVSNLQFAHDAVDPTIRGRSQGWYPGANRMAADRAARYGIPHENMAGGYAALSPQKDWFQNAEQGDRLVDILATQIDAPWTPEMAATARAIGGNVKGAAGKAAMKAIQGKSLRELWGDPAAMGLWARVFDQTHNSPSYRVLDPEGYKGQVALTASGEPQRMAWGSTNEIGNAVRALTADSPYDVSRALGDEHKVRNFGTNISNPNTPLNMTTSDTHNVAAAYMRPLGGKAPEVLQNFGSGTAKTLLPEGGGPRVPNPEFEPWMGGVGGSGHSGYSGTYPLQDAALKEAGASRNVIPRGMQSITWEGIRELFDNQKSAPRQAAANSVWEQFAKGKISQRDAQEAIMEQFGGSIPRPAWAR